MPTFLQYFVLLPALGFLLSLFVPRKKERIISGIAIGSISLYLAGIAAFVGYWWLQGHPVLAQKHVVLYKSAEFEFAILFLFDSITAVFALVGAILTFLVAVFSRYYMHREEGFRRFFSTLLLFFTGYNGIVFSGNFETFFTGWEMLGITSFLLIAFYRDRYLPVKNGFKVLSFYRLGDICLMLAMWMSHHLWHRNIAFAEWADTVALQTLLHEHHLQALFISLMILIAAAIKSAQMPFFTWLPRAMEGPTTSSAIFYGALSVHIGVFLLLRTYPFWQNDALIKGLVVATGLLTSLVASGVARVQSSVKTQIAYASIAQIGLMFVETALGFHILALVHFAGNAFLRTYQLLVSPSVLSYLVHHQFFNFTPRNTSIRENFLSRIKQALYVLNVKEWNFDYLLYRYLWQPFKWLGGRLAFMNRYWNLFLVPVLLAAGIASYFFRDHMGAGVYRNLPLLFSALALLMVLKAFAERGDARRAWLMAFLSQFLTILAIFLNKYMPWHQIGLYLFSAVAVAFTGYVCLRKIKILEGNVDLNEYHGHVYEHRGIAFVFLLSCLGLSGFPITPAFIGVDLMFTHVGKQQFPMVVLLGLNYLFLELTILRIYTRIFLGQHKKAYHPIAFKSS